MPWSGSQASSFPDRYDADIKQAVNLYWVNYPDWLAWKAQLYQESRLNPKAVSPVGAAGLAQFMPGTWRDVAHRMSFPHGTSPHEAAFAIEAGAYYMATLSAQWRAPRPALDRHRLAQASYNAGIGHIVAAQKRCGNPNGYAAIMACLPAVTGQHSSETLAYVGLIAHWRDQMALEGAR
jgi:soluble lytic murein transglycosylase-like protein